MILYSNILSRRRPWQNEFRALACVLNIDNNCRQSQMRIPGRAAQRTHHTAEVLVRAGRQVEDHMPGRVRSATATGGQPTCVPRRRHVVAHAARMHTVHKRVNGWRWSGRDVVPGWTNTSRFRGQCALPRPPPTDVL